MLNPEQRDRSQTLINDVIDATPWWSLPDSHMPLVNRYLQHGFRDAALYDIALSYVPEIIPSDATPEELHACACLHDVGKPYVTQDDETLWDRQILDDADWHKIRRHPEAGFSMVSTVILQRGIVLPLSALGIIRWHHERLDGSGYPDQLTADHIPLHVQLFSVADYVVSMREGPDVRPHREKRRLFSDIEQYFNQLAVAGKLNGDYVALVLGILKRNEHLKRQPLWALGSWDEA